MTGWTVGHTSFGSGKGRNPSWKVGVGGGKEKERDKRTTEGLGAVLRKKEGSPIASRRYTIRLLLPRLTLWLESSYPLQPTSNTQYRWRIHECIAFENSRIECPMSGQ